MKSISWLTAITAQLSSASAVDAPKCGKQIVFGNFTTSLFAKSVTYLITLLFSIAFNKSASLTKASLEKFRILTVVTAHVNGINAPPKDTRTKHAIKVLKECLKGELELLNKHALYPSLFEQPAETTPSPLHWNINKFTKRDLIELASALFASGAIVDSSGSPISYSQLIKHLSEKLNTPISSKSAFKERDYILNVKQNTSAFIDQLARSLAEK